MQAWPVVIQQASVLRLISPNWNYARSWTSLKRCGGHVTRAVRASYNSDTASDICCSRSHFLTNQNAGDGQMGRDKQRQVYWLADNKSLESLT